VAHEYGPVRSQAYQGEGLFVVIALVQTRGAVWQLVLQQHVPITNGHILQFVEGIDGGLHIPHRTEIARDLLLNGGRHGRQLRQRDVLSDGDQSDVE
jgi:hypothetical protein